MPAPNPIWGLHVTPGTAAWAKVRRETDGSFRVLEWSAESLPGTAADAVRAAAAMLQRRGVKGWGVVVAVPDDSGCLSTARLTAEELDLQGEDLARELHEHTPFEPEAASLRMLYLRSDGRRRVFLVSALPVAQDRLFQDAILGGDDGTRGIGFASEATWRGANAMGLGAAPYFLVEVHAHTTTVFAFETTRVRRYLIASGFAELAGEPGRIDALAGDVRNIAEYHRKLAYAPNDPPADVPDLVFLPAGRALADGALRHAMARTLGSGFATAAPGGDPTADIRFDKDPGEQRIALIGAIGAALGGFESAASRMALRQLPAEIATPREPALSGARGAVTVAGLALAGLAIWWFGFRGPAEPVRKDPDAPTAGNAVAVAAKDRGPVADVTRRAAYGAVLADASAALSGAGLLEATLDVRWADGAYEGSIVAVALQPDAAQTALQAALSSRAGAERVTTTPGGSDGVPPGSVRLTWRRAVPTCPDSASLDDDAKSRVAALLAAARSARTSRPRGERTPAGAWTAPVPLTGGLTPLLDWASDAGPASAQWTPGRVTLSDGAPPDLRAGPVDRAGVDGILAAAAPGDLPARLAPPPPAMTDLATEMRGESCVRIRWGAGTAARRLMRTSRAAGTDDISAWVEVAPIGAAAGTADDWLGAPGTFRYRVEHATGAGAEVRVVCAPTVTVEPVDVFPGGGVRFRLTRVWKDGPVTADADVALHGDVRTEKRVGADVVVLDAGRVLRAAGRVVQTEEMVDVRVPRLRPDGRVERDAAGAPILESRRIARPLRVLEADLAAPDGKVTKVSRKMTDG